MNISEEAYRALESVVGQNYVSRDPVICRSYSHGRLGFLKGTSYEKKFHTVPSCVILPSNTREVMDIVKIANRHKIPFVPASAFWVVHCGAKVPGSMILDLKRMNGFEIDGKNLSATVEPGIIYSQLQEEAMKRGLYTTCPGGGAQAAVIANHINAGFSPLNYRTSWANRRILGVEWVLPDGQLLRLGSLANQSDPFWGEGIGPSLHGVLRGWAGWMGSLGIVTKMAIKLLPFQTERLIPTGITPHTALALPEKRIKWFNCIMPNEEALLKAMYEIGNAQIGAGLTKIPLMWRYIAKSKNKEEFWDYWTTKGKEEEVKRNHILRVLLIGYTSAEQLEYEERVLGDIITELGGEVRGAKGLDQSWFKATDAVTMWFMTGSFVSAEVTVDTLKCAIKTRDILTELKAKFTPPLMEDYGDMGWLQISDFGHNGYVEFLTYHDPDDEELNKVDEWTFVAVPKKDVQYGTYNGFSFHHAPFNLTSPPYGPKSDYWMLKVKEVFDPNNVSNPPIPHHMDDYIDRTPWMRSLKDW